MFGKIFHGISEFFSDALPGFSVGCFLDGLLKGAVISAAVLGVIAALPEVAAVLVIEILIVAGVAGLVYLSQAWPSMSGNQRSEALGEILGGAIVGKFFPTSMLPPELPFPKLALMQTPEGITVPIIVSGTLAPSTAATLGGASSGVLMAAAGSTTGPGKGPGQLTPEEKALKDLGSLKGRSKAEIEETLRQQGYKKVIGRGGDVWTKDLGDGNTLAVRLDPPNPRATLKGGEPRADQVPHAHKELIPTSEVVNGNYSSQAPGKTTLNDLGQPSTDPTETHIPIKP